MSRVAKTVEATVLRLAGGRRGQRVRLAALRAAEGWLSAVELETALWELVDADRAVLYRDDHTAALTQADHDAAIVVGQGRGAAPRHLVVLT